MFISTSTGIVSAIAVPPRSRACSHAAIWSWYRCGSRESIVSTFQLRARRPASVISAISSTSASVKPRRQPSVTYSSVVPSCAETALQSASTSSFDAQREATGWPSPSECVNDSVVEKPIPPCAIESCSSPTMVSSCSRVASLPMLSAPITFRRSAQWPTRKPTLSPTLPSSAWR